MTISMHNKTQEEKKEILSRFNYQIILVKDPYFCLDGKYKPGRLDLGYWNVNGEFYTLHLLNEETKEAKGITRQLKFKDLISISFPESKN